MRVPVVVASATAALALLAGGAAMAAPVTYAELNAGALLDGQLHAKGTDIFLGAFDLKEKHRVGGVFSGLADPRRLLSAPAFVRHVVLDRWFLHRHQPAMA